MLRSVTPPSAVREWLRWNRAWLWPVAILVLPNWAAWDAVSQNDMTFLRIIVFAGSIAGAGLVCWVFNKTAEGKL